MKIKVDIMRMTAPVVLDILHCFAIHNFSNTGIVGSLTPQRDSRRRDLEDSVRGANAGSEI